MIRRILLVVLVLALLAGIDLLIRLRLPLRPENQRNGKFPEQLVFVRSKDDVVSGGVVFAPPKEAAKPIAIIWIHGWGANFYLPSYVGAGRALAERGFTTISANTRMHDIGNVEKYSWGKRVRGGGVWGVTSEDARDIAAWIDFAQHRGFDRLILVGHSAGWASVGRYQADTRDQRVAGLVLASGMIGIAEPEKQAELTAQAKRLVEGGAGDDLIRVPNRKYPSFISAGTLLDMNTVPPEFNDFFGIKSRDAPVARISCPLLAFYGDHDDIAGQPELDLLKTSLKRLKGGPVRVDTAIIEHADHEYVGQEEQVAQTIASWAGRL